jgi:DNA-binding transcriptional LysR family regulator
MTVELRHLRYFLVICDEGSITRAAQRTHLTQPALSRSLRQLETALGVRLIDRDTHSLSLTPAGVVFRQRAAAAIGAFEEALSPQGLQGGPLRLVHAWSAMGPATVPLLRQWRDERPDIPLELRRVDDVVGAVERGAADAGLVRSPRTTGGIKTAVIGREERVAAVSTDSPLATAASLDLADLATETIVLNVVAGTTSLELWPPDCRPRSSIEVANTDDWLSTVAAGQGVGVTTTATRHLHAHPGVKFVPLTDAPKADVVLVWTNPPRHLAVHDLVALLQTWRTRPHITCSAKNPDIGHQE